MKPQGDASQESRCTLVSCGLAVKALHSYQAYSACSSHADTSLMLLHIFHLLRQLHITQSKCPNLEWDLVLYTPYLLLHTEQYTPAQTCMLPNVMSQSYACL